MCVKLATHVRMEQLANPTVMVKHVSAQPTSKENSAIKVNFVCHYENKSGWAKSKFLGFESKLIMIF